MRKAPSGEIYPSPLRSSWPASFSASLRLILRVSSVVPARPPGCMGDDAAWRESKPPIELIEDPDARQEDPQARLDSWPLSEILHTKPPDRLSVLNSPARRVSKDRSGQRANV